LLLANSFANAICFVLCPVGGLIMESFIIVSAIGLIRHIDLRVAQIDQRAKTAGEGLYDKQVKARLDQLKTMAALVAADEFATVHLSCTDAQLCAVYPANKLTNLLKVSRSTAASIGDIVINVPENSRINAAEIARDIRRRFRRDGERK